MRAQRAEAGPRDEYTHRVWFTTGVVVLAAVMLAVIIVAADVLLVFFAGVLLAVFIRALTNLLSDATRIPARLAFALVLLTIVLLLLIGGWFLAADIGKQLNELGTSFVARARELRSELLQNPWGRQLMMLVWEARTDPDTNQQVASGLAQAFSTTLGAVTNLFIIVFMGIYLAANPAWYQRGLLRLARPTARPRFNQLLEAIAHTLRWWLLGRAVGMLVVGTAVTIGLSLLGIPLALGLGLIAALLDFVPIIGPIIAAAPAVVVALGVGPAQAVYVILMYLGIQLVEGYVLTPLIEQRSVRLPPALTIGSQVLLGVLTGAVGVVMATPLTAVIVTVVKRLYVEDTLEHPVRSQR